MKTQFDLWRKYCTETVPMAEAAGVDPWLCVRYEGRIHDLGHPTFLGLPENYTFALTVLEKRPVFVGDKVFSNNCTKPLTIKGLSKQYGYLSVGECTNYHIDILSWTPPTSKVTPKKRTFMLGDKELPCPDKNKGGYQIALISSKHFFSDFHDAQKVANAIDEILTAARDKEGQS